MTARSINAWTAAAASVERVAAPDPRFQFAVGGEPDQGFDVGGGDFGVGFDDAADAHPDRLDPFDQQIVGARCRRRAAEKPEDQDAAAPGETAQ